MKFQSANVITKENVTSVVINYTDADGNAQSKWFNNTNDIKGAIESFVLLNSAGLI